MTTVDVALICATQVACAWIIAERWYAHRDRAMQRLAEVSSSAVTTAVDEVARASRRSIERIAERSEQDAARLAELDAAVKRLTEAEQRRGWSA